MESGAVNGENTSEKENNSGKKRYLLYYCELNAKNGIKSDPCEISKQHLLSWPTLKKEIN